MNSSIMADYSTQPTSWKNIAAPVLFLTTVVIFFGFPSTGGEAFDFWFQSFFWKSQAWLIPHDNIIGKIIAYDGPKALLIIFAIYLIVVACLPSQAPHWLNRRRALYILTAVALISITSTQLRAVTHMATPLELVNYGGTFPHLLLFQSKPLGYPSHSFPAGHASGGFSLICLYWAWYDRLYRQLGLWIGLGLGGLMGLYQIARGEHMLSHTLATLGIAWLLAVVLSLIIKPTQAAD